MSWTPLLLPESGRVVGQLDAERGIYRTVRKERYHLVRKLDAYGISVSVLDLLARLGVRTVRLVEECANGKVFEYDVELDWWRRVAVVETLRDRDGRQAFVARRRLGPGRKATDYNNYDGAASSK